ncbi:MAG: hypothetical protein ACKOQ6_08725 [Bacteroidota bacterium]
MAQKFVTHLDLNQNQILNGRFEQLSSDPTTNLFIGRLYFNTTEGVIKVYTQKDGGGFEWRKLIRKVSSGTTALSVGETNGEVSLSIANATTSVDGLMSATDKQILDDATSANVAGKIVERNGNGDFTAGTITANLTGNVQGNVTGNVTGTVSDISNHDTDDLDEGLTNLYYTDTRVRANSLDQMTSPQANVDFNNKRLTNLAEPVNPQDAATKYYVDSARSGLDVKDSVRAATVSDVVLNGTQTIDGVPLQVGDRVLVKNQNNGTQNGIYIVQNSAWTRSDDADADSLTKGAYTFVEEGNTWADSGWILTNNGAITVGTTTLYWVQFSSAGQSIAGTGLTKTGNTIDVNGTADRISVTDSAVDIASTYVGQTSITTVGTISTGTWAATDVAVEHGGTGASTAADARTNLGFTAGTGTVTSPVLARVSAQTVTSYTTAALNEHTITHNYGTRDVTVQVFDNDTYETVWADVVRLNTNDVKVSYNALATGKEYRVVVTG